MNITTSGPCTVETANRLVTKTRATNRTDDIDGAKPFLRYTQFTNKPDSFQIGDIDGTKSRRLHQDMNKPDRTLDITDIEGTKGRPSRFLSTKRRVDPLVPTYTLPSFRKAPAPEQPHYSDTMKVEDIAGTHSKPLYPFPQRINHKVDDIEGAQSGWKPRYRNVFMTEERPSSLDVSDIAKEGFKSTRVTDPNRPVHYVNGMTIQDDLRYCMPKRLPPQKNTPFFSLQSNDIEGAVSGWVPPHALRPAIEDRRHFRNTNFVGDIEGAQSDTVKHTIRTKRNVNPLNPYYRSLDGILLDPPCRPMYHDPAVLEATAHMEASSRHAAETIGTPSMAATSMPAISKSRPETETAAPAPAAKPEGIPKLPTNFTAPVNTSPAPKLVMTPKERREAAQTQADIDAVRDL